MANARGHWPSRHVLVHLLQRLVRKLTAAEGDNSMRTELLVSWICSVSIVQGISPLNCQEAVLAIPQLACRMEAGALARGSSAF